MRLSASDRARFRRLLGRHSAVWGIAFVLDCVVLVVCAAGDHIACGCATRV